MKRLLCAYLLVATAGNAVAGDCAFSAARHLDLPAADVRQLKLQTQAGDLRIVGMPGLANLEFRGSACAASADLLEKLQLQHTVAAGRADVSTTAPDEKSFHLFGSNYAYIDLEVRVPQALALELADSSGDIEIVDAGAMDLTDSSGDIEIHDPRGDVRVRDTSGDIDIEAAQGNVTVAGDSSGDIEIDGARLDVIIEDDSSGDIDVARVGGNVRVGRDSSGSIKIRHVAGSAEIGSDSSGVIYVADIKGDFRVGSKSGGRSSIEYADIGGKVTVPDYD
ncbi:MAG: DUF4097 family beta strand repeat protein [Rhodanobacteraceae bacterium]|nr:DUF4097 family beta strand repeat protein [Rhodanobacteraceae bacterium]